MTVTTAPARRTVVELGADATILDAARSLSAVESPDVVLVVPSGAPLTRNAVFLQTLRRRAGGRRIVLVSSEARARSLASSVHLKAFSSISALERHELDATEHLSDARRAVMATKIRRAVPRRGASPLRALAVFMSLLTAAGVLLAVVAPSATITVAASASPLGPYEYDLRAGPNGEIREAATLTDAITAPVKGVATGSRTEDFWATGVAKFSNLTTNDIRIPVGTLMSTTDSPPIRFLTTEEKILPRSSILPIPTVGTVNINIKAIDPGPKGNVEANKITRGASGEYLVTNPAPTTGGDTKKIAVVQRVDYDVAASQSDGPLRDAGLARTAKWKTEASAPADTEVYGVSVRQTGISPAGDVVNTEPTDGTFTITVTGTATAYRVPKSEPRSTALKSLRSELAGGMDLDPESAVVDIVTGPTVLETGVQWRVRAKAQQYASVDAAQMKAALVGRGLDEVDGVATARGFHKVSVETWPSWWPRLPVLDSRITIKFDAPATAASRSGAPTPASRSGAPTPGAP